MDVNKNIIMQYYIIIQTKDVREPEQLIGNLVKTYKHV